MDEHLIIGDDDDADAFLMGDVEVEAEYADADADAETEAGAPGATQAETEAEAEAGVEVADADAETADADAGAEVADGDADAATAADDDAAVKKREFNRTFGKDQTKKRASAFVTGFDPFTSEEIDKRKVRAAKFGVPFVDPLAAKPVEPEAEEQYKKLLARSERWGTEMTSDDPSKPDIAKSMADPVDFSLERREDAVHICGTWVSKNGTKEILKFFSEYSPKMVEWINLYACNVVFPDLGNCKRALFFLSNEPDLTSMLRQGEQDTLDAKGLSADTLRAWVWRVAHVSNDQRTLLMRLATEGDVKVHPADRKGFFQYAKTWEGFDRNGGRDRMRGRGAGRGRGRDRSKGAARDEESMQMEEEEEEEVVERKKISLGKPAKAPQEQEQSHRVPIEKDGRKARGRGTFKFDRAYKFVTVAKRQREPVQSEEEGSGSGRSTKRIVLAKNDEKRKTRKRVVLRK